VARSGDDNVGSFAHGRLPRPAVAVAKDGILPANDIRPVYTSALFKIRKYSFNNNALLRFHQKIKGGPNGIISPGRYGIWPAKMRGNRA